MLHVAGYSEPRAVVASGFMSLEGDAFSTSRNRAVWAREYLEEGFHPDLLRYYLTTVGGFQDDIDFSWDRFAERVNGELLGNVGNFAYRSLLFAHRNWGGTPGTGSGGDEHGVSEEVHERITEATRAFRAGVNDYSTRAATEAGVELAGFGNEYIQRNEPWNLVDDDPEEAARVIRDCVQVVKAVAILLSPVLSGKAEALWDQLGEEGSVHDAGIEAALEAPPATFGEPSELFDRIEDDRVAELTAKLEERVSEATDRTEAAEAGGPDEKTADTDEAGEPSVPDLEPLAEERVSFGTFQEFDLRVAEILRAEPIEGADELLRLEVDLGVEQRRIVAGLRQLHDVEELPGTRIVVVANLEKTELFGVGSDGMLLAAGGGADLLGTHGDSPPGTRVQ